MDEIGAIRTQALLDVMEGEFVYQYRRICRWYSTTFHTPLIQTEELPIEHILQHYFENDFESTTKANRRKLALQLTETAAERKKAKAKERKLSDNAFLKKVSEEAKKEKELRETKLENIQKEVEQASKNDMLGNTVADLADFSIRFAENGNLSVEEGGFPSST